jgi:REP element-mobilizing transposase RayT
MAGKYLCVNLHLVWSTKGRRRLIDPQWRARLHSYVGGIARAKNATLKEANSRPDHIHLYSSIPSTITIGEYINALKANSTRWVRQTFPNRSWFSWQEGYADIRRQDEHHERKSFEEELLELFGLHGIEYDPRYMFD